MQIYLPQAKYKNGLERTRFYMEAIRRVGSLPGVRSAAGVSALPMYPVGIDFALPFTIEGKAPAANGEEPRADIRTATPGYFETMKIALLKGRLIDGRDRQGMPGAMVINETMARRYFGGEDPIGKVVRNPHGAATVVGIVGDVKHYGLDGEPRAELFMPAWQQPLNGMALVVRTASDPKGFIDSIRREILAIDPEQPIYDVSTMVDVVSRSVFLPRISMLLLGAFALTALVARRRRHLWRRVLQRHAADARARRAHGARRRRGGYAAPGAGPQSAAGGRRHGVRPGRVTRGHARDVGPALRCEPARSGRVRRRVGAARRRWSGGESRPRPARDARRSDRGAADSVAARSRRNGAGDELKTRLLHWLAGLDASLTSTLLRPRELLEQRLGLLE